MVVEHDACYGVVERHEEAVSRFGLGKGIILKDHHLLYECVSYRRLGLGSDILYNLWERLLVGIEIVQVEILVNLLDRLHCLCLFKVLLGYSHDIVDNVLCSFLYV